MTIEEKAKAYDEAIERAKCYKGHDVKCAMEYVFPELKESEDERIRKFLKLIIGEWSYDDLSAKGFKKENIIAWLEKQDSSSQSKE